MRELFLLGALDRDGGLTPLGAAMARLPIEPRLSRTLLRAAELGCLETTASVCAMVCGDEPFIRAGAAEAQQVRFRVRVNPIPVPIPSTNPNPNPKPKPEIRRCNLANVVLGLKRMGLKELDAVDWLDPPEPAAPAPEIRRLGLGLGVRARR